MCSRCEVYQAKVEASRRQAQLAGDDTQRARWLKLADQWSRMAKEAQLLHRPVIQPTRLLAKVGSPSGSPRTLKAPPGGPRRAGLF